MNWTHTLLSITLTLPLVAAAEQEVRITEELLEVEVPTADGPMVIGRDQDTFATIDPNYSMTSRPCPPFCIQPMLLDVREPYEFDAMHIPNSVNVPRGILESACEWDFEETIPGAINMPYTEMAVRLDELGCVRTDERWDCTGAKEVLLFCNGAWCGQSPTAIRAMVREGYPPERIRYYRGGMQAWKSLGLTTVEGRF